MAKLSEQQQAVIEVDGDVFVTACPGSGKTRVLTEKVVAVLESGVSQHRRVAAVTFTNRAADEIRERLHESGYSSRHLWTGTIHSFALDWILRRYASCYEPLRTGFSLADEYYARKLVDSLRPKYGLRANDELRLGFDRHGVLVHPDENGRNLVREYRGLLAAKRLIDFDCVLYYAFDMLQRNIEIARTIAAVFQLVCIDEYQDTQDLQFGILSSVVRASNGGTRLFLVGDRNQAIYASLGGMAKTIQEVKDEFGLPSLLHRELSGNYRSTQRIVDFCSTLRHGGNEEVIALAEYSGERGLISLSNQDVHKDNLAERIAGVVRYHLARGVRAEDMCVLGPSWWLLTALGRQLVLHMPEVDLDAPGLSPLKFQPDSLWFKLARLFLTDPSPQRYRTRMRWAADFVASLEGCLGAELPEEIRSPRSILRLLNAITSVEESGLAYLDDAFEQFFAGLEIDLNEHSALLEARTSFFEGAEARLIDRDNELETVDNLKKMFRHPSGITVNSCHGAKGEEYSVVICFGLLRGYVPHWERIFDDATDDTAESRRLLYVIASRAKKHLHLFSEGGHLTRNGNEYETTRELSEITWDYDDISS